MNTGDLTTLANAKEWLGLTGLVIDSISLSYPALVTLKTAPSTPLVSNLTYTIEGATGMTAINGAYPISVLTPLVFSIPFDSTAQPVYTGGGVVGISDPLVQRLISACSTYLQNVMGRLIASQTYTQTFNGQGMPTMILPQTPVTAIATLQADGLTIAARAPLTTPSVTNNGYGYTFQSAGQLALTGYCFPRGYNNVAVTWNGGYLVPAEAQTIPATAPYTLTTMAQWSAGDRGVTIASTGAALTKVTSAPAQGEYSVDGSVYTFNAADAGVAVLLAYAFVPYDVEQACIDTIGDWFRYRSRIGVTSMGIEGQTISVQSFAMSAIPSRAKGIVEQYSKKAPVV